MGSALLKLREQFRRTEQEEIAHSDSLQDIIGKITYANIISLEQLSRTHIRKPGQTAGKSYKNSSQI